MSTIATDTRRNTLYGSITSGGQSLSTVDVSEFNNVLLMVQGTYTAGAQITWECSMDGTNWTSVQAVRTDSGTAENASGTLNANQVRAWDIYIGPFNYFRVRSTSWGSPAGSIDIWCAATTCGVDPSIVATLSGAVTVGGNTIVIGPSGHSSALSLNPVAVGGRVGSGVDTTMADNDACYLTMTTGRQLITKDFGGAELDQQMTSVVTTTTSAVAAFAAAGASIRNYVTGLQAQNTSATATTLLIQDGGTTIWQCNLPASMDKPINVVFPTPLKGTVNTALNYNFGTAGASVLLNIQGFRNF